MDDFKIHSLENHTMAEALFNKDLQNAKNVAEQLVQEQMGSQSSSTGFVALAEALDRSPELLVSALDSSSKETNNDNPTSVEIVLEKMETNDDTADVAIEVISGPSGLAGLAMSGVQVGDSGIPPEVQLFKLDEQVI